MSPPTASSPGTRGRRPTPGSGTCRSAAPNLDTAPWHTAPTPAPNPGTASGHPAPTTAPNPGTAPWHTSPAPRLGAGSRKFDR